MKKSSEHLLIFDILRIMGILLVVLCHIGIYCQISFLLYSTTIFNMVFINAGTVGVAIFLFVSGAILTYNYGIIKIGGYIEFYKKRLFRVYPAYWMSLLFASLFVPSAYAISRKIDVVIAYSGFMAYTGKWGGVISNAGWFIGLIVVLYLCYPLISKLMEKHPYATILTMAVISLVSRYIVINYQIGDESMWRWFPPCNLIWFSLGIFVVRMGYYPKTINTLSPVKTLSDLSFYVYLLNLIIINLAIANLFLYIIVLMLISWMFMLADNQVQKALKSIELPSFSLKNFENNATKKIFLLISLDIILLIIIGVMWWFLRQA